MRQRSLPTALALSLAFLAACGGGEKRVDVSIAAVSPPALALTGIATLPAPVMRLSVSFTGDLTTLNGETVYVSASVPEPSYFDPTFFVDQARETLEIELTGFRPVAAAGRLAGDVTISLCLDRACTRPLGNSPWMVPFTIDVQRGLEFSPPALTIEVPFGQLPAKQRVEVLQPAGTSSGFIGGASVPYMEVGGVLGETGIEVTPLPAPAGSYTGSATVEAAVPDPSRPGFTANLVATLPITYRVLPDPTRPFALIPTPATPRFDFKIATAGIEYQATGHLRLWEQVPGGSMAIVGVTYLAAPAAAAGAPLDGAWLTHSVEAGASGGYTVRACTGHPGYDCLPPGSYQAALRCRYTSAAGVVSALELPVEMDIDPCCGETCLDLSSTLTSCGACFHACGPGYACSAGQCACDGGRSVCGDRCVDLQTDGTACGGCATTCRGAQVCVDGSCCPGGLTACGEACVDFQADRNNCGGCGVTCPSYYGCEAGSCGCPAGQELCGATCRDLAADELACGACGTACLPEQTCLAGACRCPAGESVCGTACVDQQADPTNCGGCGVTCANGEVCAAGGCACAPGSQACGAGPACIDLSADAYHCGACDAACPAGQACQGGGCVPDLSTSRTVGGDPAHSGFNAGETGTPPLTLAWRARGLGGLAPPLIERGRVVVTTGQRLVALAATSGAELWSFPLTSPSWPAVDGGRVFQAGADGVGGHWLWQVDLGDGTAGFQVPYLSQGQGYLSPIVAGGVLYTGGGTFGGLYAFDAASGAELWHASLESLWYWSPAWSGGAVYTLLAPTGLGPSLLRAHDPATGAVTASREVPTGSMVPVFGSSFGYLAYNLTPFVDDASLQAFRPGTLEPVWTVTDRFFGPPAVAGDVVYALSSIASRTEGRLRALDALTGGSRWSFDGDSLLRHPPVVAAGHLYVASNANVYALDLATHQVVWTAPVGGRFAVGAGLLLVSETRTGDLVAFRLTR
ncbi:MAG: PQQ-binding-like beta-propeller repeat protein [Anaeromyxobacter sp.]|nr:PQQ-binding-like beta-propeller repeat protein [Anaeromyxobacter sp.]